MVLNFQTMGWLQVKNAQIHNLKITFYSARLRLKMSYQNKSQHTFAKRLIASITIHQHNVEVNFQKPYPIRKAQKNVQITVHRLPVTSFNCHSTSLRLLARISETKNGQTALIPRSEFQTFINRLQKTTITS